MKLNINNIKSHIIQNKKNYSIGLGVLVLILIVYTISALMSGGFKLTDVSVGEPTMIERPLTEDETDLQYAIMRVTSDWVWKETTYSNKSWAPSKPKKEGVFGIELDVFQKVKVKTDCNDISAKYDLSNNTTEGEPETAEEKAAGNIKFSEIISTKKACADTLENTFVRDLEKVESYEIKADTLVLTHLNKAGVMTFTRRVITDGQ
jgi:heat shock protein HslJ